MYPPDDQRLERVLRVCRSFAEADAVDLDQWLELSGDERLRIGEAMRAEAFGDHEPGLSRVLRVAERQER
jgi:hypothetical protein